MYSLLSRTLSFRFLSSLFFAGVLLFAGIGARPAASASLAQSGEDFAPDKVIIRVDPHAAAGALSSCLRSANASEEKRSSQVHLSKLKVPAGQVDQAIARLKSCPAVLYAERDYKVFASVTDPTDPGFASQWGLQAIHAPQGWDTSTGATSVVIAIVDSGIDLNHPDLAGKILPGYNTVNNTTLTQDDFGHGTHVAGIAAAIANNGIGVAGVSWGARLLPVKVLDQTGGGDLQTVYDGIMWAADHGANVINMSFGGVMTSFPQSLQDAVNYAYNKGVVVVAAAGNDGLNENVYPANLSNVVTVAATDQTNTRASFSNFGPSVDLSAPGVSIYSTYFSTTTNSSTYATLSGTSMATPFVSGLAALLWSMPGYTTPDQVIHQMESTALDLGAAGRDDYYGYGLIQVDAALGNMPGLKVVRTGSGEVTSIPAGMDCGRLCAIHVTSGTSVTLTETSFAGSTFLGWSDPTCGIQKTCTVTLTGSQTIRANFTWALALPMIVH